MTINRLETSPSKRFTDQLLALFRDFDYAREVHSIFPDKRAPCQSVERGVPDRSPMKQAARNIQIALNDAYEKHKAIIQENKQKEIEDLL